MEDPSTRGQARAAAGSPLLLAGLVGLVAAGLRLAQLAWCHAGEWIHGLFLDSRFYGVTARAIRDGTGAGDHPYLLSPLYPYYLALFPGTAFEDPTAAVLLGPRVMQALLGAGTAVLVALCARRLAGASAGSWAGSWAGWWAGMLAALFAPSVHYELGILVAGPQAFCLMLALWLWLRAEERGNVGALAGAGLALGVGASLRPTLLVVALALVLVGFVRSQLPRRGLLAFALAVVLAIVPFTVRNATAGGETFLLSANGGMNLWIGNHAGASGRWDTPEDYDAYADPLALRNAARDLGHEASYGEASAWWRARAIDDVLDGPMDWLGLMARKLALFVHPREIPQLGWGAEWFADRSWLLRFPLNGWWVLLLAGAAPFLRPPGTRLRWPLVVIAAYAAAVTLFFVTGRYRAPVLPVALVLVGVSLEGWRLLLATRRNRALLLALGLVVVGIGGELLLPRALPVETETGVEETQHARYLAAVGRHADALPFFEDAIRHGDLASARSSYADSLLQLGRAPDALRQYELLVQRHPTNALGWYNYGNLLLEGFGRLDEAIEAYRRALELRPSFADAHYNLGVAFLIQERWAEALPALERALQLAPAGTEWIEQAQRAMTLAREQG